MNTAASKQQFQKAINNKKTGVEHFYGPVLVESATGSFFSVGDVKVTYIVNADFRSIDNDNRTAPVVDPPAPVPAPAPANNNPKCYCLVPSTKKLVIKEDSKYFGKHFYSCDERKCNFWKLAPEEEPPHDPKKTTDNKRGRYADDDDADARFNSNNYHSRIDNHPTLL
jgi:hypothetical protein